LVIGHDIGDAIKHSPAWREAEALLKSVPCIGDVTARNTAALSLWRFRVKPFP